MTKSNTQYARERRARLKAMGFVNAHGQHHKDETPKVQAFLKELNTHYPEFKDKRKKDEIN